MVSPQPQIVVGPRSLGVTLQLTDDITVYVDMSPVEAATAEAEIERTARRQAARILRLAAEELEAI